MRSKTVAVGLATLAVLVVAAVSAAAQEEKVLRSFIMDGQDAAEPYAGVIFDKAGNLYGTTRVGGTSEAGAVYELKRSAGGGWTESLLHSFIVGTTDGRSPHGGLVIDASGNLYGPTSYGGAHDDGTVFELSPAADGGWTETVLHSFNISTDGYQPIASLIFDGMGNLYGTASGGGTGTNCGKVGCGTVFELSPQSGGGWIETTVHNFTNNGRDGTYPNGLIFDAKGNLFGTSVQGGRYNDGVVFELSPQAGGWTESILHSFDYNGTDGYYPNAGVILDSLGNLYGTTYQGGAYSGGGGGGGTAFELTAAAGGTWTEKILYSFNNLSAGPYYPVAGLALDSSGNLYGTTEAGGTYGWGTVFELRHAGGGTWTERTLHSFDDNGKDGLGPLAGVVLDAFDNLYGTTSGGGARGGAGTAFEIIVTP
jgi:uncharacterized repeat protein (TIGR03803 family)